MESNDGFELAALAVPVVGLLWWSTLISVTGPAFWGLFALGVLLMLPVGNYFQRVAVETPSAVNTEPIL